jgi:hypothetical protein
MPGYVVVQRAPRGLNIAQLLNPIFYQPITRHPDSKRQRRARVEARALRAGRLLKAAPVPLSKVARPCETDIIQIWVGWSGY